MNAIPNRFMLERLQDDGTWFAYDDRGSAMWARVMAATESRGREVRVTYNGTVIGRFSNGEEVAA